MVHALTLKFAIYIPKSAENKIRLFNVVESKNSASALGKKLSRVGQNAQIFGTNFHESTKMGTFAGINFRICENSRIFWE